VGANRPLTDADREQVRRLHAEGKTRNDIAREIGRSPSTVSKIAAALDLTFDREATAAATAARSADLAARRTAFAATLHDSAETLHAQLFAPCTVGAFGGKDNVWSQKRLDRPLFADQRQIMSSVSIALDKSLKLVPPRDEHGAADAVSMLDQLAAGIRAIAAASEQQEGADSEGA
jgi:hypothetical protein